MNLMSTQSKTLNTKQRAIILELAKGHTKREIARKLHVSYSSVADYIDGLRKEFQCRNTTQLVVYCIENGLLK